jgi:hypothetical protein
MARVTMRETYVMSSKLKTCMVKSKAISMIELRPTKNGITREIMTCMTHTTTNPCGTAPR